MLSGIIYRFSFTQFQNLAKICNIRYVNIYVNDYLFKEAIKVLFVLKFITILQYISLYCQCFDNCIHMLDH